ncbi:hypothetical protein ETB97_011698 [Aspergillus alliaceus]|uniref:Enoyl reductase (ER) domain-containing protein n=1 Tax=Petromyces alliaceus TaxID=209559 RepID=A0A8H6E7K3_PETAA|nr:hypothetical protein ETB97_011698 [Aspergillus burnettii]
MALPTFKQYFLPEKNGFDSLMLRDVLKVSPKKGEILVRIKAVSLNWRDGIIAEGTYPFPGPDALVPGSDGAGYVEEVGECVTEWKAGDRVLANFTQEHIAGRLTPRTLLTQLGGESQGLLGEYFIFPRTGVARIPDYLSYEEASCLPCAALTAWNALYGLTPIRPGQTVLLQGTGGVSTFALQIASAAGATTIVTSSSDEKLAKAKQLGATYVINYRTTPDWATEAKRITDGRGVDHIIEVGGTLTLQASFDAVAMHGVIHCIGHITNPDPLGAGKKLRGPDAAFLALDRLFQAGSQDAVYDLPSASVPDYVKTKSPFLQISDGAESNKRRYSMRFYITTLSQFLTVSDKDNSFLSDFVPMSLEFPALADALVAWSCGHLSSLDSSYHITALQARSAALRSLAESIASDEISSYETSAATGLVLLTSEVCLGDHTRWYNHLIGVKNIIMLAQAKEKSGTIPLQGPEALKQSAEGQWVLRNFAYHDIVGSVTLGKPPLLQGNYLRGITDVVDTYLGVATEILTMISDISCHDPLNLSLEFSRYHRAAYLIAANQFWTLDSKLASWQCPAWAIPSLAALAYAYRSAALIYLYRRTLRGLNTLTSCEALRPVHSVSLSQTLKCKLQDAAATVLRHVAEVPLDTLPESALLFPLFLAGGEVMDDLEIEIIRMRLNIMLEKRQFHNIRRALEVLEEVWERRRASLDSDEDPDVDWQEIVNRKSGGLLLT